MIMTMTIITITRYVDGTPVDVWRHPVTVRYIHPPHHHIIRTNYSCYMPNWLFYLEKITSEIFKEKKVSNRISPKSKQVILCRQAIFCLSMPQSWLSVKVIKRPPSTFSQTYTFFVPNIYDVAQTVLTVRSKSHCGGVAGAGGNELKT